MLVWLIICFFFFNDTATTEIYTLSLHDALPIFINARGTMGGLQVMMSVMEYGFMGGSMGSAVGEKVTRAIERALHERIPLDRKSTRLKSSHSQISYALFCFEKKKRRTVSTSLAT